MNKKIELSKLTLTTIAHAHPQAQLAAAEDAA
jgi:hypothetical protein